MAGKKVGRAVYVHKDTVEDLTLAIRKLVSRANRVAVDNGVTYNVVKIAGEPEKSISFLLYEDFDSHEFPALLQSASVNLANLKIAKRSYRQSKNPPILHRKELLLKTADPRVERFTELTAELVRRGLFENPKSIGFRNQWQRRLTKANIKFVDHRIVETGKSSEEVKQNSVRRHKTAISRQRLSKPMQALARHGFLEGQYSLFDYGCGQGDDLTILTTAGLTASGWDPHYDPQAERKQSDLVNLGFVLNVIEDPTERVETAKAAYGLASKCLVVAVLMEGTADTARCDQYSDGVLTSLGTFQKYFRQAEIKRFLENAVGEEVIPVGPGVFFIFQDKLLEQTFLADRHKGKQDVSLLLSIAPAASLKPTSQTQTILEEHGDLISDIWAETMRKGRIPGLDELDSDLADAIVENLGSLKRSVELAQYVHDVSALTAAKQKRTEDLLVYFALNLFNRRKRYGELPVALKRDIKAFFGTYNKAEGQGRDLLYSVGAPGAILAACQNSEADGVGHMFGTHSLQLHADLLGRLPAILRAYVGCAEVLYGDLSNADLVKIHVRSGKVTLIRVEDFFGKPLPRVIERVKIRMRDQDIDFFDYTNEASVLRLTMKSRYMAADQEGFEQQRRFDAALVDLDLFDFSLHGPPTEELARGLDIRNIKIIGFELVEAGA